ncbi:receptor-like protein kinase At3g21340 isoform X2 [Punica granatum]|uniref:non-specific serine/threonine protein kinase n=1 Tax=Punica granatum TaxID=22663 RepID=A0A6P8CX78_PUNGR|nr:receptor-like protein kinase At3g21340 isoform X2 [Punica granatum]
MEILSMFLLFLFVLWTISATRILVLGEDPNNPGFISIDCGAANPNNDPDLNIYYETDDGFVDSGHNQQVSSDFMYGRLRQSSKTLRVFPNGTRNCYTIRPTSGGNSSKYLIRAAFLYGNYDGQSQPPTFDLYIGVNYWATINFSSIDSYIHNEIIHVVPSADHTIQVCLVKTSTGIPFISSLELRPLNDTMYQTDATTLALYKRLNIGSNANIRHPQDVHDRLWWADDTNYTATTKFGRWNLTSDPVLVRRSDSYDVPVGVLETFSMADSTGSLSINWQTTIAADKWIVYFHFAEMVDLSLLRDFTIYINGKNLTKISLEYLTPVTIPSEQFTSGIGFNFRFVPTYAGQSPILNAVEVYYLLDPSRIPTALDDANAMNGIKTMYNVMKESWQGDPCVPTNFTWEGVNCSTEDPPRITSLNLSSSGLKGNMANSLANLTELEYLNLSHNELTGSVPEFLAKLENLKVLLAENPNLCTSGSCGLSKKTKKLIIITSASGCTVVVVGCIWIVLWRKQSAKRRKSMESKKGNSESGSKGISGKIMRRFTLEEVARVTENFNVKKIIGEGNFGKVFRGKLDDGTEVAVKKLSRSAKEGPKQFETEAKLLLKIHHRNLVALLGFCDEPENMALIYEYLAKGNLHENLSGKNANFLTWDQRLCIAVDAAKGLDYLHNDCNPPIIHRDIKTANILLDEHLQAKISDFGLSRIFSSTDGTFITTDPVGTRGYLDPEYCKSRSLTKKSDVYSFGVVLLELITARPVQGMEHVVDWAAQEVKKENYLQQIVDPRLDGQYDSDSADKLVTIAISCVEKAAAQRPDIHKVHADLKACRDLTLERSQGTASKGGESNISSYNDVQSSSIEYPSSSQSTSSSSSAWSNLWRGFTEAFFSS